MPKPNSLGRCARAPNGTLIVFICNHCPYVKASIDRIVAEARALARDRQLEQSAIMPNDTDAYSRGLIREHEEIFPLNMILRFPYVIDRTRDVARAYGGPVAHPTSFRFQPPKMSCGIAVGLDGITHKAGPPTLVAIYTRQ